MKIESFVGQDVAEVSRMLESGNVLLYLGGEEREESVAALVEQHGARAGALLVAAMLFVDKYGSRQGIEEAAAMWRGAAKKTTKKDKAYIISSGAEDLVSWLSWGGMRMKDTSWDVLLDEMNADELFSLGNFLLVCAIKADPSPGSTCETLGIMMAANLLKEVNEKVMGKVPRKRKSRR